MYARTIDLQAGLAHPPRRNRRFPVELWAVERAGEATYHHRVTNLSVSGMFFQKEIPIRPGTTFRVELPLPTGRVVRASATVMHATATEDGPGNGIALADMFEEDREALREYLANVPVH